MYDLRHHGGSDHTVYAYAAENLRDSVDVLGRALPSGVFGENLTTTGVDVTEARIGQRWQINERLLLEASTPRRAEQRTPHSAGTVHTYPKSDITML